MSHSLSRGCRVRVEPKPGRQAWAVGSPNIVLALTFASLFLLTALVGVWAATQVVRRTGLEYVRPSGQGVADFERNVISE